jgi:GT2 family glycosyltransferase
MRTSPDAAPHAARADAPPVAIVVVNWHHRATTDRCLDALRQLTYPRWSLVLIDNGCTDFSTEEIAQRAPGAAYLRSPTNLGFAGGSNLGMRTALARGAAWVWFLNDDAAPEPDALDELLDAAARPPHPAVLGAKIVQYGRPERLDSLALDVDLARGRVRLLGHDEVDRGQYDHVREPLAVTGCAMLVRRDACERLGGFNEAYFAYLEDVDLCLRARAASLPVAAVPSARVRHDRPAAARGRQSTASLYYACRNHLVLLARHAPQAPWRSRLRAAEVLARYLAFALRGDLAGAAARLASVRRGARDYTAGVMGAERAPG